MKEETLIALDIYRYKNADLYNIYDLKFEFVQKKKLQKAGEC